MNRFVFDMNPGQTRQRMRGLRGNPARYPPRHGKRARPLRRQLLSLMSKLLITLVNRQSKRADV